MFPPPDKTVGASNFYIFCLPWELGVCRDRRRYTLEPRASCIFRLLSTFVTNQRTHHHITASQYHHITPHARDTINTAI
jgi:hypothetical protein